MTAVSGRPVLTFIFDAKGNPIGKEDQYGNLYTLNGTPSHHIRYDSRGLAYENKLHTRRVKHSETKNNGENDE